MDNISVISILLFCIPLIVCKESKHEHVVLVPKIFRMNTNNTVTVSSTGPVNLQLKLIYADIEKIQKIHFDAPGAETVNFLLQSDKLPSNVHVVYLDVDDLNEKFEKQSLRIPIDHSSGHIIIQLDKPIYKPRENVKYRILAVNEDLSRATRSIRVEVSGPNRIILDSMVYHGEQAFDAKTFYLPKEAQLGRWKIRAYYVGEKGRDQVEEFEVKEYVLPAFKVEIIPRRDIILKSIHYIRINIEARYSFSEPVEGTCTLRIGVVKDRDTHISLFDLKIKEKQLSNGAVKFNIRRSDLEGSPLWFPDIGSHMFIEANVTEKDSEIKASAINMSPVFASKYYDLQFVHSKKMFKPGMPYRLELEVKDRQGKPKPGRLVYINTTLEGGNKLYNNGTVMKVNKLGRISEIIQIPAWCQIARFVVITLDPLLLNQENKTLTVYGYTKNKISLAENKLYQKQSYFKVKVAYEYVQDRTMFASILAKGQIVFTTSFPCEPNGRSTLLIPDQYKKELPGHTSIIVYHFDKHSKLQAESTLVYFQSQCLEELELSISDQKESRPKENVTVMVNGGSDMRVGFLVVDKSVYDFSDKTGLTREKMFHILGRHNQNNMVQSKDAKETFNENGLLYLVFPTGFISHRTNAKGLIQEDYLPKPMFANKFETIPTDMIRKYFPESWYFKDFTLDSDGKSIQQLKLPDSITTWLVQAVGLSSGRGVCVASPVKISATLPVFAKVHLPYKTVRLEKVKVVIAVFNTQKERIKIKVNVSLNEDLMCPSQEGTVFTRFVQAGKSSSMDFHIIPLKTGDLPLRVAVWNIDEDIELFDAVEKKLFVVPEGKRLKKTITFPLNPQGESFTKKYTSVENTNKLLFDKIETRTNSTQKTEVDLALPVEIIPGTEDCGLQACGDLMGDVISTSLYGRNNLFVSSFYSVEEVIGNMAPAVYALEYLNSSGLLDTKTLQKGRTFITQGVTRLMKYRHVEGGFSSKAGGEPVSWLTTLVLKTLCHVKNLSFVDKMLIDSGFTWLLNQVNSEGKPISDHMSENSIDYPVVLAAEILIALKECESLDMIQDENFEEIVGLEIRMLAYIEENIMYINDTMALSKMAYALMLAESPEVDWVLEKLTCRASHIDDSGVSYWAESKDGSKPYWYRQSPDAFAIETTAYALLVHIRHPKLEPAKLADWLIRQRNSHGGFVSPSDTAVAIQALAEFSSLKHIHTTNLRLSISADKSLEFKQVFNFNTENAITKKYVMDVPTGEKLLVEANGTGIGQVQVNVAYNVPTTPNDNCLYNLTVTRKIAVITGDMNQSGLCRYCSVGCQKIEPKEDESNRSIALLRRPTRSTRSRRKYRKNRKRHRRHRKPRSRKGRRRRRKRQKGTPFSRTTLCLKICIQYRGASYSGQTNIEVEMLSGYEPMEEDLKNLKEMTMGRVARYMDDELGKVILFLTEVPNNETFCINFRIREKMIDSIQFLQPAPVVAYQPSKPEHICLQNYDSVRKDDILPMFCIGEDNRHKGECQCISGTCGTCEKKRPSISKLKKAFCNVDYLYEVKLTHVREGSVSKHIHGHVKTALMKGNHDVNESLPLVFSTRKSCTCPSFPSNGTVWVLGKNPYRFTNEDKEEIYRYMIDESTSFIKPKSSSEIRYIKLAYKDYKSKCSLLN